MATSMTASHRCFCNKGSIAMKAFNKGLVFLTCIPFHYLHNGNTKFGQQEIQDEGKARSELDALSGNPLGMPAIGSCTTGQKPDNNKLLAYQF